jgi:hypothetical protein
MGTTATTTPKARMLTLTTSRQIHPTLTETSSRRTRRTLPLNAPRRCVVEHPRG